jgi:hypothetical protein
MQRTSRTIAVLLLVTIAAALPGVQVQTQALALSAAPPSLAQSSHPAGCHSQDQAGQAPAAPTPARSNYDCCASGHHHAMASASFSLRPLVALFHIDAADDHRLNSGFSSPAAALAIPSTSPPNTSPLRI